ncbi:lipid kinase, YegS/Rv2252/BmrU family [Alkalispirochaeta americana]|uniref:Lipid kinase, YegS/Rv2252/BmrU family n=1 Tax=Alkalispirochaeta americana TaxID=159291 RepID=A0A1N6TG41_9SPIO|nr:lipid kinase, YegS/Rv2252/BmrU family [Alkalispirochaeta americana]
MLYQNILAVVNPVAGSSGDVEKMKDLLAKGLEGPGRSVAIHETSVSDDVAGLVRAACDDGVSLVVACGGDGTVGSVVNGLVGTGAVLGILPAGTGNGLARAFGIPLRPEAAVALLAAAAGAAPTAATRAVDTFSVEGRHFVLNLSVGISARSMDETPPRDKKRFGLLAYLWRIVGHLPGGRSTRYHLILDDYSRRVEATELIVSSGTLLDHLPNVLGPAETFCDGLLDVYVVNGRSLMDYGEICLRILFRQKAKEGRFTHYRVGNRLFLEAERKPEPVQGDGEVFTRTPLEVQVHRGALSLVVPCRNQESRENPS